MGGSCRIRGSFSVGSSQWAHLWVHHNEWSLLLQPIYVIQCQHKNNIYSFFNYFCSYSDTFGSLLLFFCFYVLQLSLRHNRLYLTCQCMTAVSRTDWLLLPILNVKLICTQCLNPTPCYQGNIMEDKIQRQSHCLPLNFHL